MPKFSFESVAARAVARVASPWGQMKGCSVGSKYTGGSEGIKGGGGFEDLH